MKTSEETIILFIDSKCGTSSGCV